MHWKLHEDFKTLNKQKAEILDEWKKHIIEPICLITPDMLRVLARTPCILYWLYIFNSHNHQIGERAYELNNFIQAEIISYAFKQLRKCEFYGRATRIAILKIKPLLIRTRIVRRGKVLVS